MAWTFYWFSNEDRLSVLVLVALLLAPSLSFANESMGTPAARAEFEKGWSAQFSLVRMMLR